MTIEGKIKNGVRTWSPSKLIPCFLIRIQADIVIRSPESGTVELPRDLLELVTILGRDFQKYSIDNRIYFCPVDDVCGSIVSSLISVTADLFRMRQTASNFSSASSTCYSTIASYFHQFITHKGYWIVDMERVTGSSKSPNNIQDAR